MRSRAMVAVLVVLTLVTSTRASDVTPAYRQDFTKWQGELTDDLKKNWLTLVGLFWLKDGMNRVGGDHKDEVPLPEGRVPAQIGTIQFHAGKATFTALPAAKVTSDGKPVQTIELKPDVSGKPTILEIGDVRMLMIQRGNRYGMRVRDSHSKALAEFKGPLFYPLQSSYMVNAKFVPYDKPKTVSIPTAIGQNAEMDSSGYVEFTLNGQKQHLQALSEGTPELFFIIKDQTSGKGTYPAGRFMYADPPKNGQVLLDFNKAYSPPCAWTPYATCPLPPKENYMTVKVEAGEKYQGHH